MSVTKPWPSIRPLVETVGNMISISADANLEIASENTVIATPSDPSQHTKAW